MSASEDTPDDTAGPNVDPQHAGQPQQDRWIFVEGPPEGSVDDPCDALPTGRPYGGNMLALGATGSGKTALLCTLFHEIRTKVFLPNKDATEKDYIDGLRLTDAEFRCLRTSRSA